MPPKICVVGSFMADLVVRTPRRPEIGETIVGSEFGSYLGGKGFNQAVAAARSGVDTSMIGRVGSDDFGNRFLQALESEGIRADHVGRDPREGTGVGLPIVDANGDNAIIVVPRANNSLSVADVERASPAITGAGALLLQLELPIDPIVAAARIARDAGVRVLLNAAPASEAARQALPFTDYLIVNECEAQQLSSLRDGDGELPKVARTLLEEWTLAGVVVTLGSRGTMLVDVGGELSIEPHAVVCLDSVGAGDAFCGALAAALSAGAAVVDATRYANAAGALAVTKLGAEPSMPTRAEILALLSSEWKWPASAN